MTEPNATYTTGTADTGDEQPPRIVAQQQTADGTRKTQYDNGATHTAGGPTYVERLDAAYYQAQAETAIRALEAALSRLSRMEAERDAARDLADHALAVWRQWPLKVGGTVTSGLYAELRALDAAVTRHRQEAPDA